MPANKSPATRYSTVAILLHWSIAALLIFEVGLGLRMEGARGATQFAIFQLHKSVGITILLLVALRLVWRFYRTPPPVEARRWERALAHAVHALFYLLLFALPVSGWVIVSTSRIVVPTLLYGIMPWLDVPGMAGLAAVARTGWHDGAEFVHVNLVTILYLLFALHVAGALKHHFVDRDAGIAKMAPGTRPGSWRDPRLMLIAAGMILVAGLGLQWLPIGAKTKQATPVAASPLPSAPAIAVPPPVEAQNATAEEVAEITANNVAAIEDVPKWDIASGSTLRFRTSWSGTVIEGGFTRFGGDIAFRPDQLDHSRVEIRIDTASVFSGDDQRDATLKSGDWFSVATHDNAVFRADRFRKTGTGRYIASGTLRIKGVTLPIALPFMLTIKGDVATMKGTATIDRTAYKIGEGDYASTSEIPAAVTVDVALKAVRQP